MLKGKKKEHFSRALELYQRSILLLEDNTDSEINLFSIHKNMFQIKRKNFGRKFKNFPTFFQISTLYICDVKRRNYGETICR